MYRFIRYPPTRAIVPPQPRATEGKPKTYFKKSIHHTQQRKFTMKTQTALKKFLTACAAARLSNRTQERYTYEIGRFTTFLKKRKIQHIDRVKPDTLRSFFAELNNTTPRTTRISIENGNRLSPFTIAGIYRSIHTWFNWMEKQNILKTNPMRQIKSPRTPKRIVHRLSEKQLCALLEHIQQTKNPERNLAIVLLMVDSGLRRAETFNLKLSNIHTGYIRVNGKGNKEREIPIGQVTQHALKKWLDIRPQSNSDYVFVKSNGKPISPESIRSIFRRIQEQMKLERLYFHLLRHTFAKQYLRHGDLDSLSAILGHKDRQTTKEIYVGDFDIEDLMERHRHASPVDRLKRSNLARL